MEQLAYLVVLATAIWAGVDASKLGARRGGLGGGFLDMGPVGWFFAVWLLWIVAFPCYLVARPRLVAARASAHAATYPSPQPWGPVTGGPPPAAPHSVFTAAPAPAPPTLQWAGGPGDGSGSTVNHIARLEALRDRGALTSAEFDTLKQQALGSP